MRLQKMLKFGLVVTPLFLFFSSALFIFAYWAPFVVDLPSVEGSLLPGESIDRDFNISHGFGYDGTDYTTFEGETPYDISSLYFCDQYDDQFNCIDEVQNLCPYISLSPSDGEAIDVGVGSNMFGDVAHGELNYPDDIADSWHLNITAPCFEGECPVDYDPLTRGLPLPQSQKGKTFKCSLRTESSDPPVLVRDLLSNSVAYASDDSINISVVLGGGVCTENCYSNVLFLPGISGSRMYEDITTAPEVCVGLPGLCELQRWVTTVNDDIHQLYLTSDASTSDKIYTKDVVDEISGTSNLYKSFLGDLQSWKEDEKIIEDYAAIPYDWRLSPVDIVNKGQKDDKGRIFYTKSLQNDEKPYILSELLRLAETSKTQKVTIVAHSYGGLITKELMLKLRAMGKEDLVDKIIFVAVPEVGTPDAFQTLLHGEDIGPFGVVSDSKLTRDFTHDLPGVYSLLPSSSYFSTDAGARPSVTFDNSSYFSNMRNLYGSTISNFSNLEGYLLGADGRSVPSYDDINHAAILNGALVDDANTLHNIIDAWEPSANTRVIEIAGWGEYTSDGLKYRTEKGCALSVNVVSFIPVCLSYKDKQVVDVVQTLEGDGTVVSDSAHYLSDKNTSNVEKWWVDLIGYNSSGFLGLGTVSRIHRDILEIPSLRNFIKDKIQDIDSQIQYISLEKPSSDKVYTRVQLNSPLSLDLYDVSGNHTGLSATGEVEENIPGSRYRTIGESKYILVPKDVATNLKLTGYKKGSFSLLVDSLDGDTVTSHTTFSAIPTDMGTSVSLELPVDADISANTPLKIDFNGDGTNDKQIVPNVGGEVIYDVTPPELKVVFDITKKDAVISAVDLLDTNPKIVVSKDGATMSDASGNTTVVSFTKFKEHGTELKFNYKKINRNGVLTSVPKTSVEYEWKDKKGVLTDLDTKVTIKGEEKYVFSYNKAKDVTTIKYKVGKNSVVATQKGLLMVSLVTDKDIVNVSY